MLSFKTNRFPEVDNRRHTNVVRTSVVTFSTFIQLIKKTYPPGVRAITDFVSFLLFNFRRALIGYKWFKLYDVICLVARAKIIKVVLGFLSRAGFPLFLRHFKGFTDCTDFEGCWEKRQSNISDTLDCLVHCIFAPTTFWYHLWSKLKRRKKHC